MMSAAGRASLLGPAAASVRTCQRDYDHDVQDRPDGWTDLIYTRGYPEHSQAVAAHRVTITSDTRGRGAREKTTWFLACACDWRPSPPYQAYNADRLKNEHLAHLRRETER